MTRGMLLESQSKKMVGKKSSLSELAGGTAAECAVVGCCCPCVTLHLLMVIVTLPARICRKVKRQRRRKEEKEKSLLLGRSNSFWLSREVLEGEVKAIVDNGRIDIAMAASDGEEGTEVGDDEKEMMELFYGAGFWRSASQRGK